MFPCPNVTEWRHAGINGSKMQLSDHKVGEEADTPSNSCYLCQNCARSPTCFKPIGYSKYEGLEDGVKARITQWNSPSSWVWFHKLLISQPQGKERLQPKEVGNGPFSIWAATLERSPGTRTLQQFQTHAVTLFSSVNILVPYAETQSLHLGFLNLTSLCYGYGSKSTLFSETSAFNTFLKSCVPYVLVAQIKCSLWVVTGLEYHCSGCVAFWNGLDFHSEDEIFDMASLFWNNLK